MHRTLARVCGTTLSASLAFLSQAQVVIDTVTVNHPGNLPEPSGAMAVSCGFGQGVGEGRLCGRVDYVYDIGRYEITAEQYVTFLNAVARTDTYGLYNTGMPGPTFNAGVIRSGVSGSYTYTVSPDWASRPIGYIAWADALRFANWMHNGQPSGLQNATTTEDGSYTLNGATTNPQLQQITRNPNATWVLPNEDEWYKAAYHKANGPSGSYADYATNLDDGGGFFCTQPSNRVLSPDPGTNANWSDVTPGAWSLGPPYWKTPVGEFEHSGSDYGTFDQSGNIAEWTETRLSPTTNASKRVLRGGSFYQLESGSMMHAAMRDSDFTAAQLGYYGFRLAYMNLDCNANGTPDQEDIRSGASQDTNYNNLPDECDIAAGRSADCNTNGIPDEAEVGSVSPTPYTWDDGQRDDPIGFGLFDFGNIGWLNHFTVQPGRSVIDAIALSYGYTSPGRPVTVCLWSDPNADGSPVDAVLLASVQTAVANPMSDVLNTVDIPDVDLGPAGTSFFVGAIMAVTEDDLPVNLDTSGSESGSHFESWLVINFDTENPIDPNALGLQPIVNVTSAVIDPVNVMVRAIPAPLVVPADTNHDGLPDSCAACDADVNQDGNVDQDDVGYLINVVGGGDNPTGVDPDFNRDGNVDQDDISALINTVGGGGCP